MMRIMSSSNPIVVGVLLLVIIATIEDMDVIVRIPEAITTTLSSSSSTTTNHKVPFLGSVHAFTPASTSQFTLSLYHPHHRSSRRDVLLHDTTVTPTSTTTSSSSSSSSSPYPRPFSTFSSSPPSSFSSSSTPSFSKSRRSISDDLLENEKGKINPELAQQLWKWELDNRLNLQILGDYSTRRGLRWVKDLVEEKVSTKKNNVQQQQQQQKSTSSSSGRKPTTTTTTTTTANYDDLIQEGVRELMQSLLTFEQKSRPEDTFETYAKGRIRQALDSYVLDIEKGTGESHSHRQPLSMESTVAVLADPLEAHNYYFSQDEWEEREGLVLDDGKSLNRDELVDEYIDETIMSEGDDQMWVHEQQVVVPLPDSIASKERNTILDDGTNDDDDDKTNDDDMSLIILKTMLLHNVDNFLSRSALDEDETVLIQMQFGLNDGIPKPQKEIARELNLTVNQVRKMRKRALSKLRQTFTNKYFDDDDTSDEDYWEDTA